MTVGAGCPAASSVGGLGMTKRQVGVGGGKATVGVGWGIVGGKTMGGVGLRTATTGVGGGKTTTGAVGVGVLGLVTETHDEVDQVGESAGATGGNGRVNVQVGLLGAVGAGMGAGTIGVGTNPVGCGNPLPRRTEQSGGGLDES